MKNKILTLILAGAVILSALSGCSSGEKAHEGAAVTENGTRTPETDGKDNENTEGEQGGQPPEPPKGEITAESIGAAVKAAYGGKYLPDTPMDGEMLRAKFGFEEGSYTEIFAESPMIGTHPDTLVIVKAAEGKLDSVREKLTAYREALINDTMQYPMNLPKIHASQVVVKGDYAAFILLGEVNENVNSSEEEQARFAEEQVKIGVDAFNKCF